MATPSLGVDDLSTAVNNAVLGSSDPSAMSSQLFSAISGWFSKSIFPIIMTILIFITVVFVFYGSYQYFTAYGNEAKAESAKKTITFAIIGFIIALLAFSAATFVQRIIIKKDYEATHNAGETVDEQSATEEGTDSGQLWNSQF
jgi:type III secretory pathway component EscU